MKKLFIVLWMASMGISVQSLAQRDTFPVLYPYVENGKMGYIFQNGNVALRPVCEPLAEYNMVPVNTALIPLKFDGKVYIYNRSGKKIIEEGFKSVEFFPEDNLIKVTKYVEKNPNDPYAAGDISDIIGFYDCDGKEVIPVSNVCEMGCGYKFSDGLWLVTRNGKMGAINLKNELVVPAEFTYIENFKDGMAIASKEKGTQGVIDKTGKWIVKPTFKHVLNAPSTGYAFAHEGNETVIINKQGKIVKRLGKLQVSYMAGSPMVLSNGNGIIEDTVTKKFGIIAPNGDIILKPTYDYISLESCGVMVANIGGVKGVGDFGASKTGGKWTALTLDGKEKYTPIPAEKMRMYYDHDIAAFKQNGLWGFLDREGTVWIEPIMQYEPSSFNNGLAKYYTEPNNFGKPRSTGYFTYTGNIVLEATK